MSHTKENSTFGNVNLGDSICIDITPPIAQAEIVQSHFLAQTGLSLMSQVPSHEGWEIYGDLCQIVHITLAPGQAVQSETGAMCYASDQVKQQTKMGGIGRLVTGEGLFKNQYKNNGSAPGYVGLTAPIPATLIPINLDALDGTIKCKRDAFLGSMDPDCKIGLSWLKTNTCLGCCCSGVDMVLQNVQAKGWVFLAAHGTIMTKTLKANEGIMVDHNSVVAVSSSVTIDAKRTGGCSTMCCGGEGLFMTELVGPGVIIIASMPLEKLRRLFYQPQSRKSTAAGGAASVALSVI